MKVMLVIHETRMIVLVSILSQLAFCFALPVADRSTIITAPKDNFRGDNDVGASWGAAAVADHNLRPWEDPEQDVAGDSLVNTPVSDLFPADDDSNSSDVDGQSTVPLDPSIPIIGAAEMHAFPHQNRPIPEEIKPNQAQANNLNPTPSPTLYPVVNSFT